jgi:pimeloyl-ACP methyl ester carboxylesterase
VLLERARSDPAAAMRDMALWSHKGSREQPPDPALVQASLRLMESVQARWPAGDLLATDLGACNAYAHGLEMARRLRMPVQLVLGESDRMTPMRATEELRAVLPQAGVSRLDAGHALMQERPQELAQSLLELLGRV